MDFCCSETHVTRACNVVMVGMCQDSGVPTIQSTKQKQNLLSDVSIYTTYYYTRSLISGKMCNFSPGLNMIGYEISYILYITLALLFASSKHLFFKKISNPFKDPEVEWWKISRNSDFIASFYYFYPIV